jgi:hypothetical protein
MGRQRMSARAVEVAAPWGSENRFRIEVQRVDASCSWQTRPVNLPSVGHRISQLTVSNSKASEMQGFVVRLSP